MKKVVKRIAAIALTLAGVFTFATTNASAATADNTNDASFSDIYKVAKSKLGASYVYGAVGPNVFDCSGFTSYVYKKGASVTLPRTAQAQYNTFKHVSYKNIKKGDLVFFGGSKYSISHVGMYIGNGKMIDAQNRGVVREAVHAPWWHAVGYARVTTLASNSANNAD
ncbi:MAG TPA: C40 family peptidase [Candidatus Levilactobacillus faecigallinarum]|uniref:C40 family peptidase n=1 Tax=Candidatus Levilactobacillus faecigallinarum TaxID=2838638 RepID=A0A9D1QTG9_9LACO|nr:C40 family peptidase [Candidatus Levilactobacillus faecigallinarum]